MTYTGYLYEEIVASTERKDWQALLWQTDLLVDGPFMREQTAHAKPFCGSANQRILELKSADLYNSLQ